MKADQQATELRDRVINLAYIKLFNQWVDELKKKGVPIDISISRDKASKWFDIYMLNIENGEA